jgi:hypothetical protein
MQSVGTSRVFDTRLILVKITLLGVEGGRAQKGLRSRTPSFEGRSCLPVTKTHLSPNCVGRSHQQDRHRTTKHKGELAHMCALAASSD